MPVPKPSGTGVRELPGFYYGKYQLYQSLLAFPMLQQSTSLTRAADADKKRYFNIESNSTAPSRAAWSAENVKKRKAEKDAATKERKRQEKTKNLIKRSSSLAHAQTGSRLAREFGVVDPDMLVENWTAGLREKGQICFLEDRNFLGSRGLTTDTPNISCMFVNGDDKESRLGTIYTSKSSLAASAQFYASC